MFEMGGEWRFPRGPRLLDKVCDGLETEYILHYDASNTARHTRPSLYK